MFRFPTSWMSPKLLSTENVLKELTNFADKAADKRLDGTENVIDRIKSLVTALNERANDHLVAEIMDKDLPRVIKQLCAFDARIKACYEEADHNPLRLLEFILERLNSLKATKETDLSTVKTSELVMQQATPVEEKPVHKGIERLEGRICALMQSCSKAMIESEKLASQAKTVQSRLVKEMDLHKVHLNYQGLSLASDPGQKLMQRVNQLNKELESQCTAWNSQDSFDELQKNDKELTAVTANIGNTCASLWQIKEKLEVTNTEVQSLKEQIGDIAPLNHSVDEIDTGLRTLQSDQVANLSDLNRINESIAQFNIERLAKTLQYRETTNQLENALYLAQIQTIGSEKKQLKQTLEATLKRVQDAYDKRIKELQEKKEFVNSDPDQTDSNQDDQDAKPQTLQWYINANKALTTQKNALEHQVESLMKTNHILYNANAGLESQLMKTQKLGRTIHSSNTPSPKKVLSPKTEGRSLSGSMPRTVRSSTVSRIRSGVNSPTSSSRYRSAYVGPRTNPRRSSISGLQQTQEEVASPHQPLDFGETSET